MNILITGCNRGLGLLLTKALYKHNVIATARDFQSLQQNLQHYKHCQLYQLDVTKNEIELPNIQIDVLVHNAAILETQLKDRNNLAKQVFDVNYYGVINLTKKLLPQISPNGKILVISSNLGKLRIQNNYIQNLLNKPLNEEQLEQIVQKFIKDIDENNDYGQWFSEYKGIYSASKALINTYCRHILSKQIKQQVLCIHPGWLRTDMGGQNAPQAPEEGIITSLYAIENNIQGSGLYLNEKCQIEDWI